jgi:hypothetical protein
MTNSHPRSIDQVRNTDGVLIGYVQLDDVQTRWIATHPSGARIWGIDAPTMQVAIDDLRTFDRHNLL